MYRHWVILDNAAKVFKRLGKDTIHVNFRMKSLNTSKHSVVMCLYWCAMSRWKEVNVQSSISDFMQELVLYVIHVYIFHNCRHRLSALTCFSLKNENTNTRKKKSKRGTLHLMLNWNKGHTREGLGYFRSKHTIQVSNLADKNDHY